MAAADNMLAADPGEVADVLGENRVALVNRDGEHVDVRPTSKPALDHGNGVDALSPQRHGQRGRVHLVEEKLHPLSAAAVS